MERADVETVLVDRLASSRGVERDAVLGELARGAAIDSLEGLELAVAAEAAFGIAVSDDELSSAACRSFPGLVGLVRSKLNQARETKEAR